MPKGRRERSEKEGRQKRAGTEKRRSKGIPGIFTKAVEQGSHTRGKRGGMEYFCPSVEWRERRREKSSSINGYGRRKGTDNRGPRYERRCGYIHFTWK